MNVLVLVSRDWRHPQATGGDALTCDLARYLAGRGHNVTLLAARYPGSAREETREGLRIVRPGGLFWIAVHAFVHYLRRRGGIDVVIEEGMASVRLPFASPLYVRKPLLAVWYQLNESIYRAQYPRPVAWALTLAERMILALHRGRTVLVPSRDRREELVAAGMPEALVSVLPPLMLDSRAPAMQEPAREPLIVWLGKIRRYKSPHDLVQALPRVAERVPDARLVIAGRRDDEGYERELVALADALGVGDRVDVRTDLSDGEKWDLLARAKALVVTSPVEGFGIVIVEANQCGTPVVATDGVPLDTVQDGYNGLRVPFGDVEALGDAIGDVLADNDLFDRLSANARRHAEQFGVAEIGSRLEETLVGTTRRAA